MASPGTLDVPWREWVRSSLERGLSRDILFSDMIRYGCESELTEKRGQVHLLELDDFLPNSKDH
jgi:hypothetical protein